MNVNGIYIAVINVAYNIEMVDCDCFKLQGDFVKLALVKPIGGFDSNYKDLATGETYHFGNVGTHRGDLYILKIVPYADVISTKKQDMSKRKILRRYNECKNEVYNEYKNKIEKEKE